MDIQVNRAKLLWDNWEEKASKIQDLTGTMDDNQTLKYKYQFLTDGLHRLSVDPSEKEKIYIHAMNVVTDKLRKQLYPNPLIRLLHRIKNTLIDKPMHLLLLKEWKKESVNGLQDQLKVFGLQHFAGKLNKELDFEREIIDLKSQSNVNGNDKLEVRVHLEKLGESGYHLNGYTATLTSENGETKSATFSPENNIKLTEALNLLQGRPIYKSLQNPDTMISKNWVQLEQSAGKVLGKMDLVSFAPNYEYDLRQVLLDASIQLEVYGISVNAVQKGIEAGNKVAFEVEGKGKFYVASDPQEKALKFFDIQDKPITFSNLMKLTKPIKQSLNQYQDLKLIKQQDLKPENQLQVSR